MNILFKNDEMYRTFSRKDKGFVKTFVFFFLFRLHLFSFNSFLFFYSLSIHVHMRMCVYADIRYINTHTRWLRIEQKHE